MAKFCSNCGAPMADDDLVCGQCGTPAENTTVNNTVHTAPVTDFTNPVNTGSAPVKTASAESQNAKVGKIIVFSAIGLIALLLLLLIGRIVGNNTGYKGTLNKYVKGLKNEDTELLYSISSELLEDYIDNSYYSYKDIDDFLDKYVESKLDTFDAKVGNISNISYTVEDFEVYSDRKAERLLEDYETKYDSDISEIKQVADVKIKLNVKGSKRNASFTENLALVKEKGGWKILQYSY